MRVIVFDIETQNTFDEVGSSDPADLDISCVVIHDSEDDQIQKLSSRRARQTLDRS